MVTMQEIILFIVGVPAILKIALAFTSILVASRFGLGLGWSILLHSVLLCLWTGTGIDGLLSLSRSLIEPKNYLLYIVISLLLFFTEALRSTGRMEKTVKALTAYIRNKRILFAGLPALVGLLPMPGGALFSAPLVDSVDEDKSLTNEHKSSLNYWFRHIWEYWWPLYPGVILAIRYSELPPWLFFCIQVPLTGASLIGGYFFILRKVKKKEAILNESEKFDKTAAAQTLLPIGILVLSAITLPLIGPSLHVPKGLESLIGMVIGLLISLTIIFAENHAAIPKAIKKFNTISTWGLLLVVVSISAFSSVLQMHIDEKGTTLVLLARDEFIKMGIPLIIIFMVIPFISGLVTGVAFGFVGASFPIVFALLGENPSIGTIMATATFTYGFGYLGMILSPIHICYVVSNQYFKVPFSKTYPFIIGPTIIVCVMVFILSGIYYFTFR